MGCLCQLPLARPLTLIRDRGPGGAEPGLPVGGAPPPPGKAFGPVHQARRRGPRPFPTPPSCSRLSQKDRGPSGVEHPGRRGGALPGRPLPPNARAFLLSGDPTSPPPIALRKPPPLTPFLWLLLQGLMAVPLLRLTTTTRPARAARRQVVTELRQCRAPRRSLRRSLLSSPRDRVRGDGGLPARTARSDYRDQVGHPSPGRPPHPSSDPNHLGVASGPGPPGPCSLCAPAAPPRRQNIIPGPKKARKTEARGPGPSEPGPQAFLVAPPFP